MSEYGEAIEQALGLEDTPTGELPDENVDQIQPKPPTTDPVETRVARAAAGATVENPLGGRGGMAFNLYMPELGVRMINAAHFGDYEWWSFAASASLSAVVGFFVAFLQSGETVNKHTHYNYSYLMTSIVFFVLLITFIGRAAVIRSRLNRNSRTYKMKATEEIGDSGGID